MPVPVLFLEANSGFEKDVEYDAAIAGAKLLVEVLRQARRINQKIGLNTAINIGDCQLRPGLTLRQLMSAPVYREEWRFLRVLSVKSPISNGYEDWIARADLKEASTPSGQASSALTWADLLESGTVSFHAGQEWLSAWIKANCFSLDEGGASLTRVKEIRNLSCLEHLAEHEGWLKALGFDELPSAKQFWEDAKSRYPGLRFLDRVQGQIIQLSTSGAPYKQALNSLDLLNEDALAWQGEGSPSFSAKVADGEHDQRRALSMFEDDLTKTKQDFSRHTYFTGGTAGRIHFRLSAEERKFVIAHVGFKL